MLCLFVHSAGCYGIHQDSRDICFDPADLCHSCAGAPILLPGISHASRYEAPGILRLYIGYATRLVSRCAPIIWDSSPSPQSRTWTSHSAAVNRLDSANPAQHSTRSAPRGLPLLYAREGEQNGQIFAKQHLRLAVNTSYQRHPSAAAACLCSVLREGERSAQRFGLRSG